MRPVLRTTDVEPPEQTERSVVDTLIGPADEAVETSFERCRVGAPAGIRRLRDVSLHACDLSNSVCTDLSATRVELRDCRLTGLDVSGGTLRDVRCIDCQIRLGRAFGTKLERCWFENCDLREADFDEAALKGVIFRGCDLREARFVSSRLGQTDLRGSRVEGIAVNPDLLRGAVIASEQADVFAAAMGLRVLPASDD
ncbi:MAG: pentapeptide repeat-containing protein [Planctomycetota bacterium]